MVIVAAETRTTYRRADGQSIKIPLNPNHPCVNLTLPIGTFYETHEVVLKDLLNKIPPADYIEEQHTEPTLIKYRTVRLGADEPCEHCTSYREFVKRYFVEGPKFIYCDKCECTGVTHHDLDPPWTTVTTGSSMEYPDGKGNISIVSIFGTPPTVEPNWKAIADKLAESGGHLYDCSCWSDPTRIQCSCGWHEAEVAYYSTCEAMSDEHQRIAIQSEQETAT